MDDVVLDEPMGKPAGTVRAGLVVIIVIGWFLYEIVGLIVCGAPPQPPFEFFHEAVWGSVVGYFGVRSAAGVVKNRQTSSDETPKDSLRELVSEMTTVTDALSQISKKLTTQDEVK